MVCGRKGPSGIDKSDDQRRQIRAAPVGEALHKERPRVRRARCGGGRVMSDCIWFHISQDSVGVVAELRFDFAAASE